MIDWQLSVGAILGILLSVFLAHRLTIRRENIKAYNQSTIEFKNLIIPFIKSLEDINANPSLLVVQYYSEHDEAARKLMNVLPKSKYKKFQKNGMNIQSFTMKKKNWVLLL